MIPEAFELNLNYRFAPGKTVERAQQDVRELVGDAAEVEFTDLTPSGRVCAPIPALAVAYEKLATFLKQAR
ncbi:MAG: hypothetical protein ACXU86_01865 [Archangium sp.]